MLVLSRRLGESIVIGGNIRVVVSGISGNQVKLSIEAPRSVPIYRSELWDAIRRENEEAARAAAHQDTPAGGGQPASLPGKSSFIKLIPGNAQTPPKTDKEEPQSK
ncbi:MAG TPA: carbon storage regulator [Planctomycetes bacterium]|nr:carbon storage regulator [Planctomycetota bacterium]